ncbi:MAG: lipopolysaccharide transport system ATP-binding protein [Frankiaceae bacterium]|nr:lipopolysaccharide transport system ATP-binding protein [Frankiaceae bacterium]
MTEWAVKFDHVSKLYRRASADYRTLRDVLMRRTRRPADERARRPALSDVSLTVDPGECYAFVGPNGAGKTSALRLVARIGRPTSGVVSVAGRVGALMEVGSGIHPELTARENIWLYGSILGMSRADIAKRFDQILDFAELDAFVDRQVRFFSSGMQLRLGFSIAAHLEPDVFVVDEALAVGDAAFQSKCLDRMSELVRGGSTVLFVSHNLAAIEALCQRGVLLIGGETHDEGPIADVLKTYLGYVEQGRAKTGGGHGSDHDGPLQLLDVTLTGKGGEAASVLRPGQPCALDFHFRSTVPVKQPHLNVGITDGRPGLLLQCSMLVDGGAPDVVDGDWRVRLEIDELPLRPRLYHVYADVFQADAQSSFFPWTEVLSFRVESDGQSKGSGALTTLGEHLAAPVLTRHRWT